MTSELSIEKSLELQETARLLAVVLSLKSVSVPISHSEAAAIRTAAADPRCTVDYTERLNKILTNHYGEVFKDFAVVLDHDDDTAADTDQLEGNPDLLIDLAKVYIWWIQRSIEREAQARKSHNEKVRLRNSGLAKLTPEERKALGLNSMDMENQEEIDVEDFMDDDE